MLRSSRGFILFALALVLLVPDSKAQDIEPRRWGHLPIGSDYLAGAYGYTTGDITLNPALKIEGLLRTMYDPRNNLANEVSAQLIQHFGDKVFRTVIPRNVRLAEAPSFGVLSNRLPSRRPSTDQAQGPSFRLLRKMQ